MRPAASRVYFAANGEVARALPSSFPFADAVHRRTGQDAGKDATEAASGLAAPANGGPSAAAEDKPATLFDVMRATIGQQLRTHYEAPRIMTHQLLVLLMQLNEERRTADKPTSGGRDGAAATRSRLPRRRARSNPVAVSA